MWKTKTKNERGYKEKYQTDKCIYWKRIVEYDKEVKEKNSQNDCIFTENKNPNKIPVNSITKKKKDEIKEAKKRAIKN